MFSLPSAHHLVGQFTRSWHSEDAATWPKRFLVPGDLVGIKKKRTKWRDEEKGNSNCQKPKRPEKRNMGRQWEFMNIYDGNWWIDGFFHKRQAFWFWTWGASGNRWWSFVEQIQGKARRLSSVHANVALENPSLFRYVQIIPHLYSPIGSMVLVYIC